jgi:hypothetical protein
MAFPFVPVVLGLGAGAGAFYLYDKIRHKAPAAPEPVPLPVPQLSVTQLDQGKSYAVQMQLTPAASQEARAVADGLTATGQSLDIWLNSIGVQVLKTSAPKDTEQQLKFASAALDGSTWAASGTWTRAEKTSTAPLPKNLSMVAFYPLPGV